MKKITYNDTIEFNLPNHWATEEVDNIGVFYEQGDDTSTLRVELLVAKSPEPVDKNTSVEMLGVLSKGDDEITTLEDGIAYKCYLEPVVEDGESLIIHYWYVAHAVAPDIGRLVTFSFTTLSCNKGDDETLQIIGMLDHEIKSCRFL
ncbi:MAG: hypothetical protein GY779_18250 [Gammaproteobacteria bacterium]|nr:hypothetical protein [Gammaproteobacteria bacterium]